MPTAMVATSRCGCKASPCIRQRVYWPVLGLRIAGARPFRRYGSSPRIRAWFSSDDKIADSEMGAAVSETQLGNNLIHLIDIPPAIAQEGDRKGNRYSPRAIKPSRAKWDPIEIVHKEKTILLHQAGMLALLDFPGGPVPASGANAPAGRRTLVWAAA